MDSHVALNAKKKVVEFCWGLPSIIQKLSLMKMDDLNSRSIMAKRIEAGCNVVIHGEPRRTVVEGDGPIKEIVIKPMGRTFIASILTKEALRLTCKKKHRLMSVEWVEFNTLMQMIKDNAVEATHYEFADWLVVDNISDSLFGMSAAARSFIVPQLDAFFDSRLKGRRSTVLSLRFNLDKNKRQIESYLGTSLIDMIEDGGATVIDLTNDGT